MVRGTGIGDIEDNENKQREDSRSSGSNLLQNDLGFIPLIHHISLFPTVKNTNYPVDNFLFLSGLRDMLSTIFVETLEDLLEFVYGVVVFDTVPVCLNVQSETLGRE